MFLYQTLRLSLTCTPNIYRLFLCQAQFLGAHRLIRFTRRGKVAYMAYSVHVSFGQLKSFSAGGTPAPNDMLLM